MHVSWDGLSTQSKSGNRKRFWQGHIEAGASLAKQVLAAFEDAICMTCTDDGKPNSAGHYSATRRTSQQPTTADSTLLDVHRRALASKEAAREKAEADAAEANATAAAAAAAKMSSLFSAVPNGLGTNDEPMSEAQLEQRRQMERTRLLNELGMDYLSASFEAPVWKMQIADDMKAEGLMLNDNMVEANRRLYGKAKCVVSERRTDEAGREEAEVQQAKTRRRQTHECSSLGQQVPTSAQRCFFCHQDDYESSECGDSEAESNDQASPATAGQGAPSSESESSPDGKEPPAASDDSDQGEALDTFGFARDSGSEGEDEDNEPKQAPPMAPIPTSSR